MTAMTADIVLPVELADENDIPLISGAVVFEGSAVGLHLGYARALVYNDIFAGHAIRAVDNSGGVSGVKSVHVRSGTYRLQVTLASVAQSNVTDAVYMTYDGTYTLDSTLAVEVGRVARYVTTDTCVVEFTALAL